MADWFVQKTNGEHGEDAIGPLKPSELLEMVRKGEIVPESKIRKDDSKWFDASDVGGLFEAAIRPSVEYYCPQCDTRVTEPPVVCPKCLHDIRKAREEITENSIRTNDATKQSSRSVQNWLKKRVKKNKE